MQIEITNLQSLYCLKENEIYDILQDIFKELGKEAGLSVVFVDDKKIMELNNSFLGKNNPTDVLAFSLDDSDKESFGNICGEIIVSVETAIRVAKEIRVNVDWEIYLYVVHGLLHLIGYDDKDSEMAEKMHNEEKRILSKYGIAVIY